MSEINKNSNHIQNLGYRLTQARKNKGLSQEEVAKRLGMSISSIAMYETGRREPNLSRLLNIANFYQVNLDYLISGKQNDLSEMLNTEITYKNKKLTDKDKEMLKFFLDKI